MRSTIFKKLPSFSKLFIVIYFLLAFQNTSYSQITISRKSGQTVFMSDNAETYTSNKDSLVSSFSQNATMVESEVYHSLLNKELELIIRNQKLHKEIALQEYNISLLPKDKKKDGKKILDGFIKEQNINKEELKKIDLAITSLTTRNTKNVEKLIKEKKEEINKTSTSPTAEVITTNDQELPEQKPAKKKKEKKPKKEKKGSKNKVDTTEVVSTDSLKIAPAPEAITRVMEHSSDPAPDVPLEKTIMDEEKVVKTKKSKADVLKIDAAPCMLVVDGKNDKGKKTQETQSMKFFTYTPKLMQNYYKLNHFLTGMTSLEKTDGSVYINVTLKFESNDVKKSYGTITTKDFSRIEFISGFKIFLKPIEVSDAEIEKHTGATIYKVKYVLNDNSELGRLESDYVDTFGIMWTTGFESYPIYEVDAFRKLISCIK
jgi:hypothetical protein